MTDPDRRQLDDLTKASTIIFTMIGDESYFLAQTHADNPEIPPSEVVILTITRKHVEAHPLPVTQLGGVVLV